MKNDSSTEQKQSDFRKLRRQSGVEAIIGSVFTKVGSVFALLSLLLILVFVIYKLYYNPVFPLVVFLGPSFMLVVGSLMYFIGRRKSS